MKVTLNWLKQYVDFNWSPEELAERLTMIGIEVEGVQKLAGEFEGVVVAQILSSDKHPNADKLSVCRVTDGQGERQIVCGATNYKVGDKVPLILPGHSLPAKPGEQPFTIKVGKIRGVESQGMMCSPRELGLAEDAEGLLILPADATVGQPFAEHLGRSAGDVVYDLEITPNRPDLNSVIGIAREISALTGNPLRMPEVSVVSGQWSVVGEPVGTGVGSYVAVRVEDPELCPRYTARIVRGVQIRPSPDWLKNTLEKVGIRSINNVVDVTNYVMLEVGQPLHAFDYHLITRSSGASVPLAGVTPTVPVDGTPAAHPATGTVAPLGNRDGCPTIVVRRARTGEVFVTLNGQKHVLTNDMLLIADETKAIALAGVMGGQNSEINATTRDVLIESAYFQPQNIRRTSKALALRSESSYRFERGADIGICDWASQRAAQLILQTAGGEALSGVIDAYPRPAEPKEISLRHPKVNELLGIEIPSELQVKLLTSLGLECIGSSALSAAATSRGEQRGDKSPHPKFRIPSFRVDLKREVDLIEEIARLYGVDRIPSTPPRGAISLNAFDAVYDQIADARRILTGLGLNEAQGQTLIGSGAGVSPVQAVATGGQPALLSNPLSGDMDVLRPSLLPGLVEALRHNQSHGHGDVSLFEIGRVFSQTTSQMQEERHLAIAVAGRRNLLFWSGEDRDAKFDLFDLKGLLEEFLEQFGVRGLVYVRRTESTAFYIESALVQLGRQIVGELGQLLPSLAKRHDLRDAVFLAELNLDMLLIRRNSTKSFKPLPAYPTIRRDVAMFLPEASTHEAVLNVVKQVRPQNLESVELFDVFRGKNVPPGQKSVAYAFTYRHAESTLTDAEVNAAHEKLVAQFKQTLQAVVREGAS